MTAADNRAAVQRAFDALSKGDQAGVVKAFAPERQGDVQRYHQMARSAIPDLQITVEDMVAENDRVVTRWSASGTHRGPAELPKLGHVRPTGKQMHVTGITIFRLANGQIVETWGATEKLEALQGLGLSTGPV